MIRPQRRNPSAGTFSSCRKHLAIGRGPAAVILAGVTAFVTMGRVVAAAAIPQAGAVNIVLENDNELERTAREQLQRLLQSFDVERWTFTREIRIASMVAPHSHPVLTVNTKYLDDDHRQLSTFVHEQFHWWVIEGARADHLGAAIEEFESRYPDPPDREHGGGNDRRSNYLHLVVCDLELQAMTALIGEPAARELISTQDHYQWIYDKVLNDEAVREINSSHGFIVP